MLLKNFSRTWWNYRKKGN